MLGVQHKALFSRSHAFEVPLSKALHPYLFQCNCTVTVEDFSLQLPVGHLSVYEVNFMNVRQSVGDLESEELVRFGKKEHWKLLLSIAGILLFFRGFVNYLKVRNMSENLATAHRTRLFFLF
ncbi:NEDD4 family-interacting protein 2 [Liparis tanakae]|uniref:NEDD4 family-interacting protein 2 n=1 Tax=Liparis tanakae TaxID=230148 RepID=A0A4Z2GUH3_9TELE|nr:NEDD4 family-interacting protein 2 [Liparis tanakae]